MKRKRPHPRSYAGMQAAKTEELVKMMDEEEADEDYRRIKKVMSTSPYGIQKQRETELAKQIFGNAKIRQNIAKQMTDPEAVQRRLFDQHAPKIYKRMSKGDINSVIFTDDQKQQFPDFFDQALYHAIFPPSKLNAITYGEYNIEDIPLTENAVSAAMILSMIDKKNSQKTPPVRNADPIALLKRVINKWGTEDKERLEDKARLEDKERLEKEMERRQLKIDQPEMSAREYLGMLKELDYNSKTINGQNPYPIL